MISAKQIGMIHALVAKLQGLVSKEELVLTYTDGRSESTKDLQQNEAKALIAFLLKETGQKASSKDLMNRKIMSMAHEMRWEVKGGKVDIERINNWCLKFGYLKKPLNEYSEKELPKLVSQFEGAYQTFLKGI